MGTLRTLFAIAVVFAHSLGNLLVGGRYAVQLFYMISGFLISYVLFERKTYPNIKSFYINRYLILIRKVSALTPDKNAGLGWSINQ